AYGGSFFASAMKSKILIGIFIFFIFIFSAKMLQSGNKKVPDGKSKIKDEDSQKSKTHELENEATQLIKNLPSKWIQSTIGVLIGFSSALVGVGGGVFTSTYLLYFKSPIHLAIGTSAAIGFPIAIAGSLSYIVNGWNNALMPEGSLGFIYLPALLGIVLGSVPFAYLGARLSHKMDKNRLKIFFAIFLLIMGINMAIQEYY
ncbi:MAG: sulfite exporter TauE/SafE family protein, partial [Leptospira sp.]|nr:sulfite exporter TauE/SafE family protein [Leptospira sp.]